MSSWFHYRRRVGWIDVDPSQNYRFTAVLAYVEEAEVALLRERGALESLYPDVPRTFVHADFHSPARFEDEVTVALRVRRVGRSSIEYEFRITGDDDLLLADGSLGSAFIDAHGKPQEVPAEIRARLIGRPQEYANAAG